MNLDPDILRATLGDLVLQVIALQSQLKAKEAEQAEPEKAEGDK